MWHWSFTNNFLWVFIDLDELDLAKHPIKFLWVRFGQVWVLKKKTQPKLTQSQKGFKLGQWVWIFFLKKISK